MHLLRFLRGELPGRLDRRDLDPRIPLPFFFLWFRATFPRYRYDQIMRLGWKVFIPVTLGWIFVTALMAYYGVFEVGA